MNKQPVLKKGCYSCFHMQYETPCYEYPHDGDYFYCDGREDCPEEIMKTWPANRKLKCFTPLPEGYELVNGYQYEDWRIQGGNQ